MHCLQEVDSQDLFSLQEIGCMLGDMLDEVTQ